MPRSKTTKGTVLLQHLLIFEALESPTAHDLGSIGSADFRERANRIVKMTQISILNQLLRKLKSNIWLLKKPTHIFSSKNVMKLLIMTTKFKFGTFIRMKKYEIQMFIQLEAYFRSLYRHSAGYQFLTMGLAMISF